MRRMLCFTVVVLWCCPLWGGGGDDALKRVLFGRVQQFMVDWQRGDAEALRALLMPDFVYVGETGPVPGKAVVGTLTRHCHLVSYQLGEPTLLQTGTDTGVLIYSIHQDLNCYGRPEATNVMNTDTLVRRGGRWLFLMTTSTPLHARPGPPA